MPISTPGLRRAGACEAVTDALLEADVVDIDALHRRHAGTQPAQWLKLVLNTQPPLHEIWLAARAGGYHFWVGGRRLLA